MLSNLLDKLGSLLSKYFVIGSFIPVLIFVCLNGALLYWNAVWFRAWVDPQLFGAKTGFFAGAMLIGLAVAAYVLSSVSVFLREVLEGKHVGPLLPKGLFENPQHEKRNRLDDQRRRAHEEADKIVEIRQKWPEILVHASREGAKNHQKGMRHDGELGAAVEVHKEGRILSTKGEGILCADDFKHAVELLADELKKYDKRNGYGSSESARLTPDRDQREELIRDFLTQMDDAVDAWTAHEVQAFNEREFRFGIGAVAPTAMGNVAQSMQSYAYSRYRLNLATFWSRLQPVLQANKDYYTNLLDAKTQLDFLVACCWLSGLTTVVWLVLLLSGGHLIWPFLVVSAAGPLLSRFFYSLAVKNYFVFADLVRTGVDLYRFGLLQSLHVTLPRGIRDERATWRALERLSSYGQEEYELSYLHLDKPQSS